ncbi:D-glycero-beta-D-manno-heptose 1-phosphate adenylyltransferase [Candidatus Omnitrophota bacterium]
MRSKLIKAGELTALLKALKKKKKKIVFTNGCFDLLHPGHIKLFKESRKHGDLLIIGLNSDSSIKRLKGKGRPILAQKARVEVLASLDCIDFIVIFAQDTPLRLIAKIKPDVLIKGGDWARDRIVGRNIAKKVVRVKLRKGHSTTALLKKIRAS